MASFPSPCQQPDHWSADDYTRLKQHYITGGDLTDAYSMFQFKSIASIRAQWNDIRRTTKVSYDHLDGPCDLATNEQTGSSSGASSDGVLATLVNELKDQLKAKDRQIEALLEIIRDRNKGAGNSLYATRRRQRGSIVRVSLPTE